MKGYFKMTPKNSLILTWIGIIGLFLSAIGLIVFAPRDNLIYYGISIGEGSVFFMWAIKETYVQIIKNTKASI